MNKHILEKLQIVPAVIPVDLQTGANTGDYVDLSNYGRCAIVFLAAAGTAGDDPVISLRQATDVADAGGKALNFDRIDVKNGTLTSVGTFTSIANTDSDYTDDASAEVQNLWVIDIKAEDLDIDNGYCCLRVNVADVGTHAKLGALLYLLHEPRYAANPVPSAIV